MGNHRLITSVDLPPLPSVFAPVRLHDGADVLADAARLAPLEGAGTLVWSGGAERCAAAVVLEPDRPLGPARLAFLVAANALGDALSALAPPELPVRWRWPGTLAVNIGTIGTLRLAWPENTTEDAIPDWLAVGFDLRLAWPAGTIPGDHPGETALLEEGFDGLIAPDLVGGWALHLMANMDEWQARGARRVAENYLARLEDLSGMPGVKRGIDPNSGALLIDRNGWRETWPLS